MGVSEILICLAGAWAFVVVLVIALCVSAQRADDLLLEDEPVEPAPTRRFRPAA